MGRLSRALEGPTHVKGSPSRQRVHAGAEVLLAVVQGPQSGVQGHTLVQGVLSGSCRICWCGSFDEVSSSQKPDKMAAAFLPCSSQDVAQPWPW